MNAPVTTKPAEFGLDIRPIGGRIGAEIHGIALSGSLQPGFPFLASIITIFAGRARSPAALPDSIPTAS